MTTREKILARPAFAQTIIKMIATKLSVEERGPGAIDGGAEWESYAERALAQWDEVLAEMYSGLKESEKISEAEFAELAVAAARNRTLWGKILAEGTN